MMRGIVLGDLWGIEEDVWVQLWSGTAGAIVSAVVAALVAVVVLTRSNAHQRKLATEQLTEQRLEARRVRERAALAEIISIAEGLITSVGSREAVRSRIPALQTAMARWRIELGKSPMEQEVTKWSSLLLHAADELTASIEGFGYGGGDEYESWRILNDAVKELTAVALAWPSAGDDEQVRLREQLTAFRLKSEEGSKGLTSA